MTRRLIARTEEAYHFH